MWLLSDWSKCSHMCQGTRYRRPECRSMKTKAVVFDVYCQTEERPREVTEICNTHCVLQLSIIVTVVIKYRNYFRKYFVYLYYAISNFSDCSEIEMDLTINFLSVLDGKKHRNPSVRLSVVQESKR